jgi:hypothetical protein
MSDTAFPSHASAPGTGPREEGAVTPRYRPIQRFWPYVDLPEEPTDEEVAAIDPALRAELFGGETRPFSVSLSFPRFDGDEYETAVGLAKKSAEYQELGSGEAFRHRARYYADDVAGLHDLWVVVGSHRDVDVLIDDRPVPYARTLWLPLCWFLLFR